jgi:hypothetical protein
MACPECRAFRSNHKTATERYAALAETLDSMASVGLFEDPAYRQVKIQIHAARLDCRVARAALMVHVESHKLPSISPDLSPS